VSLNLKLGFGQDSSFQKNVLKKRQFHLLSNPFNLLGNLSLDSNETRVPLGQNVRVECWRIDDVGEAPATSWIKSIFGTEDTGMQWKIIKGRNSALHSMYKDPRLCLTEKERNIWINFHSDFLSPKSEDSQVGSMAEVRYDNSATLTNGTFVKNIGFTEIQPTSPGGARPFAPDDPQELGIFGGTTGEGIPSPSEPRLEMPTDAEPGLPKPPESLSADEAPKKTWRVTSNFGRRIHPTLKIKGKMHNGIDVGIPVGTPMYSPIGAGRVIKIYNDSVNGKGVKIEYAARGVQVSAIHMSQVSVRKGQSVTEGTPLGKSGNTGRSSGPHVHVAVKRERCRGRDGLRCRWRFTDPLNYKDQNLLENLLKANIKYKK
jgi:murein DD-endopeptidase MepM/ murein hydrolase activator NlpD